MQTSLASNAVAPIAVATGELEIPRVLVVDDSETVLAFVRTVLSRDGYQVTTSDNVFVSALVLSLRPHLVLMDVDLGISLGTVAVAALKRCGFASQTRFVLYSSTAESELAELAKECGADAWFRKTESASALSVRVRSLLDGHPARLLLDRG